jgi:hypothetical protein
MLEIFCFGPGMTRTAQIRIDPASLRGARTRVEYQEIQHFWSGTLRQASVSEQEARHDLS